MRLVGASVLTIQAPFILETLIAAALGASLAVGMLWATVHYGVTGYLSRALPDTAFIGVADVMVVGPLVLGGVAVLAIVTSAVTLRRYLRV